MSGIEIKPSHKGLLHRALGIKQGEKIPESALRRAKKSSDPAERKRATFAENAKHWNHSKQREQARSAGRAGRMYGKAQSK